MTLMTTETMTTPTPRPCKRPATKPQAEGFTDADAPAALVTDAGMDYLRQQDAQETAKNNATASLAFQAPDAGADTHDAAGEAEDAFTPDTADKADWVLGKIADHRARAARIRENMELMAREQDQAAAFLEWKFGPALQAFTRAQTENGKKKSVRLPNGVLGYRTKPASVTIGDVQAATAWAKVNLPAAVVTTIDKKAVTDALKETGEAVPFAAFTPSEEVFYIK